MNTINNTDTTESEERIILNVYFSGTNGSTEDKGGVQTQVLQFYQLDQSVNISEAPEVIPGGPRQYKMYFDGCGIAYGLSGALFGHGLEIQCDQVVDRVKNLLRQGKKVKLNCFGLSRGAIAAMLLAKRLGSIDKAHLEQNHILFDPVPGNFLSFQPFDWFNQTLAGQVLDLTDVENFGRVLALYPYEPLPDIVAHAPVVPRFDPGCQVELDVVLGCHQGALDRVSIRAQDNSVSMRDFSSALSFVRIHDFLKACGVRLVQPSNLDKLKKQLLSGLVWHRNIFSRLGVENRAVHSTACKAIRREGLSDKGEAEFLNLHHVQLQQELTSESVPEKPQLTLHFDPPRAPSQKAESNNDDDLSLYLLSSFIQLLINENDNSEKQGKLKVLSEKLNTYEELTQAELRHTFRNILVLCLQRQRNSLSFISTCDTGYKALSSINNDGRFSSLASVLHQEEGHVRYRDLRRYVLGKNSEGFFNSRHKVTNFAIVDEQAPERDNYSQILSQSYCPGF